MIQKELWDVIVKEFTEQDVQQPSADLFKEQLIKAINFLYSVIITRVCFKYLGDRFKQSSDNELNLAAVTQKVQEKFQFPKGDWAESYIKDTTLINNEMYKTNKDNGWAQILGALLLNDNTYSRPIILKYNSTPVDARGNFIKDVVQQIEENAPALPSEDQIKTSINNLANTNLITIAQSFRITADEQHYDKDIRSRIAAAFRKTFPQAKNLETMQIDGYNKLTFMEAWHVFVDAKLDNNVIETTQAILKQCADVIDKRMDTAYTMQFGLRIKNDINAPLPTKSSFGSPMNPMKEAEEIFNKFMDAHRNYSYEEIKEMYEQTKDNTKEMIKNIQEKNKDVPELKGAPPAQKQSKIQMGTQRLGTALKETSNTSKARHTTVRYALSFIMLYTVMAVMSNIEKQLSQKAKNEELEYTEGIIKSLFNIGAGLLSPLTNFVKNLFNMPLNMTTLVNSGGFNGLIKSLINKVGSDNGVGNILDQLGIKSFDGAVISDSNFKNDRAKIVQLISNPDIINNVVKDVSSIQERTLVSMFQQIHQPTATEKVVKKVQNVVGNVSTALKGNRI